MYFREFVIINTNFRRRKRFKLNELNSAKEAKRITEESKERIIIEEQR